ncbi:MAG: cob(I)yrinic acid a,c-diamide adenosyltransferase [Acholeplasmataceae bacterium]
MKIYTKKGDQGGTDLIGKRVEKDDLRIELNGLFDETMALIILAKHEIRNNLLKEDFNRIHEDLYIICYEVAQGIPEKYLISKKQIEWLEMRIDEITGKMEPLNKFIQLDQTRAASWVNLVRVSIRKAERMFYIVKKKFPLNEHALGYCNRLSDYFFTVGRYLDEVPAAHNA